MVDWATCLAWLLVAVGAVGGAAALRKLNLQRQQLGEQQKVLVDQTRVLEREQAEAVDGTASSKRAITPT
jgi:hypothetical protein